MFPGETVLSGGGKLSDGQMDTHYSDFQVMKSGAGWYIGTVWTACATETCSSDCAREYNYLPVEQRVRCQEPGTRETDYFETEAEAIAALVAFKETGDMPQMRY